MSTRAKGRWKLRIEVESDDTYDSPYATKAAFEISGEHNTDGDFYMGDEIAFDFAEALMAVRGHCIRGTCRPTEAFRSNWDSILEDRGYKPRESV